MVAGLDRRQEFSTDDGGVRRLDCSQGLGTRGPQGVPRGDETVYFPQKGSPDFDEAGPKRRMNQTIYPGPILSNWALRLARHQPCTLDWQRNRAWRSRMKLSLSQTAIVMALGFAPFGFGDDGGRLL